MICGAYNAINGWIVFVPLVGFEMADGPFLRVEYWGSAAVTVARKRNFNLIAR